jgi:sec-independent protein translocase protein TatA
MPNVGPMELAIVLVLALLVFGPKKLPEIGKGLGQAMREFKKVSRDIMNSFNDDSDSRSYPSAANGTYASVSPETTYPYHPPSTEPAASEPAHGAAAVTSPPGPVVPPTMASSDSPHAPASAGHETAQAPERTS